MTERFDVLVRFWELRARYDATGVPLTEAERNELLSPVDSAASEGDTKPGPRDAEVSPRGVPATLTVDNGSFAAHLRQIAPELLVVSAAEPLAPGERTTVHVADAVSGVEYRLPCVVRWARDEGPWLMGLAVAGIPTRATFKGSASGLLRSPLRMPARAAGT